jgi:RHS repeat-associated protein
MPFRFLSTCFALVSISSVSAAQTYTPAQPDNALTPGDPIGVPPQPSKAGTYESVSNTNGGLSFFLPVLTLPQRGGWNLTLGLSNTSPSWNTRSDSSTEIINQGGGAPTITNITYNNTIQLYSPLAWNLPSLTATIEYAGPYTVTFPNGGPQSVPVICITNWVFTDWSGNKHPFSNVTECSANIVVLAQVTDSSDGSWLRLDTGNYHSNITVRTKDGTTYNFPGWPTSSDPFMNCNQPSCYGNGVYASSNGNSYAQTFSSMVDSTGQNTITNTGATLTDTIGRTISFLSNGISYKDANGNTQSVTTALTQQAAQPYNFSLTCSQGKFFPNLNVTENYGSMTFNEGPFTYTVTLPAVNGVSRVYTLQFDGVNNLLQVNYPAGGYTKYDYQDFTFFYPATMQSCSHTQHEVAHRRECPLSSGCSSSQELVTTYAPGPDGVRPYNDSMAVQDPSGNVTYVVNTNFGQSVNQSAPHETTRQIFPPGQYPSGTPLRTIQTSYTTYIPNVDVQVPASVTTTLNDVSPALSAVTNYQFQTVTMSLWCFSGCPSTAQVSINNATETDEYDYGASNPTKKTGQTWMSTSNGSLYDIAGGHLLDRLSTRTITDPATGVQSTLSYGYNSVGDITSKVVGGTGLSSLTTSYQRDAYGNITQTTDPKSNITKFGYADSWAQSTCAPGSNSSAFLTSITDALNHVTNFSYNSCNGSKASATDPNGARTSYSYDALGRTTAINYPDGGQATTSYVDSAPNSVTASKLINSSTGLQMQTKTILDGFSRTTQTQLLSDPDGVTYTDTTYDVLGRVATVSNPYRTSNDAGPTNGIATYFYDTLSRTCLVVPPDGTLPSGSTCPSTQPANTVFTTYSGKVTTVTDQAGKARKSVTDALGRMTQVTEDPSGLAYVTNYGYDGFGNLTSVVQNGSRQRNFSYDALSRLVSATNPESGTISYSYDADSNAISKTSPTPNQTQSSPTPGTGSAAVSGTEQVINNPAQQATGRVTINYSTQSFESITVGSYTCSLSYPRNTQGTTLAGPFASCLNKSGLVTASPSSNIVFLTSIVAGTAGNYSLSMSGMNGSTQGMSGGTNASTTYDTGSVWVSVNGVKTTVNYGQGSTSSSVAGALVQNWNSAAPATAAISNSSNVTINLTATTTGPGSNYTLAAGSSTSQSPLFSGPSFTVSLSGSTLTGGANPPTVTIAFCYDALNRLTSKAYTTSTACPQSSPVATYLYDQTSYNGLTITNGIYRRTGMSDAAGAEAWSYDSMGRTLADKRTTNSISEITSYTYQPYVDGSLYQLTYPSARTVTFTMGGAGRELSAVDQPNSINYATGAHYSPAGALAALTNGASISSTFLFNSRLQPCWVYATTGMPLTWNTTACSVTAATGSIIDLKYNFALGSADNGNVGGITNNVNANASQNFTYDSLNRLATAQTTGTHSTAPSNCWAETYTFDAWGNLYQFGANTNTQSAYIGCSQESGLTTQATANNQLSGYCYDAAGNVILNATCPSGSFTPTYSYNSENQLTSTAGVNYTYDGDGKRVMKSSGTIYWYGMSSDPLDETDLTGSFSNSSFHEYVFFDGKRVARRDSSNNIQYYFADHLGSSRVITNSAGSILDNSDFYPFGGERVLSSSSGNRYKFTSKERDSESGLDEFGARYYSSTLARFTISDWAGKPTSVPYADFANPQSLNLYAFTKNNPVTNADTDGHCDGSCILSIATWVASGIARDGSPKEFAKNVGVGAAKGAGSFVYNAGKTVDTAFSSMGNPAAAVVAALKPGPAALEPSNTTQAQASVATQVALTVATVLAPGMTSSASAGVADASFVVRGGAGEMPPPGTTFSGAQGATLEEAASGVPHGTIRSTTAGAIREGGGSVESAPELTRSGVMNDKHVNITEGTTKPSSFSDPQPNPVPKKDRIQ